MKLRFFTIGLLAAVAVLIVSRSTVKDGLLGALQRTGARATVAERLDQYGGKARQRLQPHFVSGGISYSPLYAQIHGAMEKLPP